MKIFLFLFLLISPAFAQQTVITKPFSVTSVNGSGTITTSDTFQTVFANGNRNSCTIQNNASSAMWVYFGARTTATKAASIKLTTGQGVSCIAGSVVLKDEVAITGTSGDVFFAAQQ